MPTGESSRSGPAPKPASKRRNTTKPANWGLSEPIKAGQAAPQPPLGFPAHAMVLDMWKALHGSTEARFFSAADWQRARVELLFMHKVLEGDVPMVASNWQRIQAGLSELLVSPADKRRAGIELAACAEDPDEQAAVLQMAKYEGKLAQ